MRLHRIALAALTAALAAAALACTAGAATLTLEPEEISASSAQELTFENGGGVSATCNFTMSGTLENTIIVEPGTPSLIGAITEASRAGEAECEGVGGVLFLIEAGLAWNVEVEIELNPETRITFLIENFQFLLHAYTLLSIDCLYAGDVTADAFISGNEGTIGSLTFEGQEGVPLVTGNFFCPDPEFLVGTMSLGPEVNVSVAL